jgi:predicted CopG family antitoxin
MNELEVKFSNSTFKTATERGSLSILREFVEKQEALLDIQESHFIAVSDEIIRELKAADREINKSQQEIDSLRVQTRSMLSEIWASMK